jgi:hypothetical protein
MKHFSSARNNSPARFGWMFFLGLTVVLLSGVVALAAPLKLTIASDSTAAYFPQSDAGRRWG